MIEMTNDLITAMRKFKEIFGDVVPLRELPQAASTDDVIEAIQESIEKKTNLLPSKFGYKNLEDDNNILI